MQAAFVLAVAFVLAFFHIEFNPVLTEQAAHQAVEAGEYCYHKVCFRIRGHK